MWSEMGAIMTSRDKIKDNTNVVRVVVKFIDSLFDNSCRFFNSIVGLPISSNKSFVSREKIPEQNSIEHIF